MRHELRKQQEINHYNKQAANVSLHSHSETAHYHAYSSYVWVNNWIQRNCLDKRVLDYGCGTGLHTLAAAQAGAREVVGIDLSDAALANAKIRARNANKESNIQFIPMDCERLEFASSSFDVILDIGTFSSLDLEKALSELARVLKPDGYLVGIETLGHNPLTNLKRRLNVLRGTRTKWAAAHIFKTTDCARLQHYFNSVETHYFHLLVLFAMPFYRTPLMPAFIKILDKVDKVLLMLLPFLKKYAFKVVFVLSKPKQIPSL